MVVGNDSSIKNYSGVHQHVLFLYIYTYISSTERSSQSSDRPDCSGVRLFQILDFCEIFEFLAVFLKMVWITKRAAAMIALSFL